MPSNVDLESIRFSLKKHKMAIYITISRTSTFNGMAGFKTEAEKTYLQCWLQWRFIVFDQLHHKTCKIAFLSRFTRRHINPYPWWFHFVQPSIFHSTAGKWQSWSLLSFWVFRNVTWALLLLLQSVCVLLTRHCARVWNNRQTMRQMPLNFRSFGCLYQWGRGPPHSHKVLTSPSENPQISD